jgi:hypothetical protein
MCGVFSGKIMKMKNKSVHILFFPSIFLLIPYLRDSTLRIVKILSLLLLVSSVIGILYLMKNSTFNWSLIAIVSLLLEIVFLFLLNLVAFILYLLFLLKEKVKKEKHKINNFVDIKNVVIYLLLLIIFFLFFWIVIEWKTYLFVSRDNNFVQYYDHGSSVKIVGDWDDDTGLADEVSKHEIYCDEYSMSCEWLSASIQGWNNNYLSVDSSVWPITEWNDKIIRAINEVDNRTEEITFYRDSCKMIYVKTPTGNPSANIFISDMKIDDITLSMSAGDSWCKITKQ